MLSSLSLWCYSTPSLSFIARASRRCGTLLVSLQQAIQNGQIGINLHEFRRSKSTFLRKTICSLGSQSNLKSLISATFLKFCSQVESFFWHVARSAFSWPCTWAKILIFCQNHAPLLIKRKSRMIRLIMTISVVPVVDWLKICWMPVLRALQCRPGSL